MTEQYIINKMKKNSKMASKAKFREILYIDTISCISSIINTYY